MAIEVAFTIYMYQHNSYPSTSLSTPNIKLTTIYYATQIGYNFLYSFIALAVLIIAYYQLNKTREATTITSLTNAAEKLNEVYMLQKRKELAEHILSNANDKLYPLDGNKLKNLFKEIPKTYEEMIEIAITKNKFETVAYQFEILGYYYKKNVYKIADIYELFSYELQRYWLLFEKIGLIKYLRDKEKNGEETFYKNFEELFNVSLKFEILVEKKSWFWNRKKKIESLKNEKIAKLGLFLIEESNII